MKKIFVNCLFNAHYDELEKFKRLIKNETDYNFSEAMRVLINKVLENPSLLK